VFAPFLSPVSFHALGLPPNTSWTLSLENSSHLSSSPFLNLSLPNGSYTYSVAAQAGEHPAPGGSFDVNGKLVLITLAFTPFEFEVLFAEYGLPNGTVWTLTFLGNASSQTGHTATFAAANGSYPFQVAVVSGYRLLSGNGTVEVAGRQVTVLVEYGPLPVPVVTTTAPSPSPPYLEYGLAALVVLALVVGWWVGRRGRASSTPTESDVAAAEPQAPSDGLDSYDSGEP
ncbi:MAG: hypothetical protein L3K11_07605, partial [Thermoplasmata archaeon]|nr:hypothetical protein [Thermoplasmata archaeon]